jgi:hypothetical protein
MSVMLARQNRLLAGEDLQWPLRWPFVLLFLHVGFKALRPAALHYCCDSLQSQQLHPEGMSLRNGAGTSERDVSRHCRRR